MWKDLATKISNFILPKAYAPTVSKKRQVERLQSDKTSQEQLKYFNARENGTLKLNNYQAPKINIPNIATKISNKIVKVANAQAPVYHQNITIPGSQGGTTRVPNDIAQSLMNNFDDIKEATHAATVLHHPLEKTTDLNPYPNYGENASFKTGKLEVANNNGTVDRGLMRINSGTFSGMQQDPFWNAKMKAKGITSYDDMANTDKNTAMARLILERGNWNSKTQTVKPNPSWGQWFAAPKILR